MKRLLVMLLMSGAATAADRVDLLQSVGTILGNNTITTGRFTQAATVAALSAPLVSAGSFYFDQSRGISWHVERPISAQFQFLPSPTGTPTGTTTTPPEQSAMGWIGQLLNTVLAGDLTQLNRMFTIDGSVAAEHWTLSLVPKAPALRRVLVRIDIDGATAVERIRLREANGDDVTITFSDIRHPESLPPDIQREIEEKR